MTEELLYYPSRILTYLLLYFVLGTLLTPVTWNMQLYAVVFILLAAISGFFLDLYLQNFLHQPPIGKIMYVVTILVFAVAFLYCAYSTYFYLTLEIKNQNLIYFQIFMSFISIFLAYSQLKVFLKELWDLDIA